MHVTDELGLKRQDVEIEEAIDPTGWPKPSNITELPKIPRPVSDLSKIRSLFRGVDTRTKKQKEKAKRKAKLAKIARKKNRNK